MRPADLTRQKNIPRAFNKNTFTYKKSNNVACFLAFCLFLFFPLSSFLSFLLPSIILCKIRKINNSKAPISVKS